MAHDNNNSFATGDLVCFTKDNNIPRHVYRITMIGIKRYVYLTITIPRSLTPKNRVTDACNLQLAEPEDLI